MVEEIICYRDESVGQIKVVAIEVGHNLAGRMVQALGQCVRLPAIFFTDAVSQLVCVFANYFQNAVGASAVDDNTFQRLVVLLENGKNRLFKKLGLIKRRGDNRELW